MTKGSVGRTPRSRGVWNLEKRSSELRDNSASFEQFQTQITIILKKYFIITNIIIIIIITIITLTHEKVTWKLFSPNEPQRGTTKFNC